MADRMVRVTSDRQWQALVRALKAGAPRLTGREQADVRRFLEMHHDATTDDPEVPR